MDKREVGWTLIVDCRFVKYTTSLPTAHYQANESQINEWWKYRDTTRRCDTVDGLIASVSRPAHPLTNLHRLLLAAWYNCNYPVKAPRDGPVVLLEQVLGDPASNAAVRAIATYMLGMMYFLGRGVNSNLSKGFSLVETAAGMGNVRALYFAGSQYARGRVDIPIQRDVPKATGFLVQAAQMGNADAMYRLAMLYHEDISNSPDKKTEVVLLMLEAAKKDNFHALEFLGRVTGKKEYTLRAEEILRNRQAAENTRKKKVRDRAKKNKQKKKRRNQVPVENGEALEGGIESKAAEAQGLVLEEDKECPVCLEVTEGEDAVHRSCRHWFCQRCFSLYLPQPCPLCRRA